MLADLGGLPAVAHSLLNLINYFLADCEACSQIWAAYRRSLELGGKDSNVGPGERGGRIERWSVAREIGIEGVKEGVRPGV